LPKKSFPFFFSVSFPFVFSFSETQTFKFKLQKENFCSFLVLCFFYKFYLYPSAVLIGKDTLQTKQTNQILKSRKKKILKFSMYARLAGALARLASPG
jgi:hypothetical protein